MNEFIHDFEEEIVPHLIDYPKIEGPYEVAYGYGFPPTTCYWYKNKRVLLYYDFDDDDNFCIELSEMITDKKSIVYKAITDDLAQTINIIIDYLLNNKSHSDFDAMNWELTSEGQDESIFHPPNDSIVGNITAFVKPTEKISDEQKNRIIQAHSKNKPSEHKKWWQFWK